MTPTEIMNDKLLPDCIKSKIAAIQAKHINGGRIADDGSSHATNIDADFHSAILEWHDREALK